MGSLHEIGLDSSILPHRDVLQLQRLAGNRQTTSLLLGRSGGRQPAQRNDGASDPTVIQRYAQTKLSVGPNSPSSGFLFDKRVAEGDATTGVHNYAVVLGTWGWAKSSSNRHAEIKLLLGLRTQPGEEINIVSEFKPCDACKKDMEDYERDHGVTINAFYLIDYAGRGDGDPDTLRLFYVGIGKLVGGGVYVYQVAI